MNTKKIAKLLLGLADSFDTNDPDTTNYRADTLRQIANEIEPQPEPRNDEKSHLTDFEIDTITEFKPLGPLAFIKKLSPLAKTQISRIDDIEGFFARLRGDDIVYPSEGAGGKMNNIAEANDILNRVANDPKTVMVDITETELSIIRDAIAELNAELNAYKFALENAIIDRTLGGNTPLAQYVAEARAELNRQAQEEK